MRIAWNEMAAERPVGTDNVVQSFLVVMMAFHCGHQHRGTREDAVVSAPDCRLNAASAVAWDGTRVGETDLSSKKPELTHESHTAIVEVAFRR